MDPIDAGDLIFKHLAEDFGNQKIVDHSRIKDFFSKLIEKTGGWVILDFLNAANWDKVESFDLSDDEGVLTLIRQDYRKVEESQKRKEVRQVIFPAALYSLSIAVSSVVPVISKNTAIFLLNGYAKTEKELKKLYRVGSSEIEIHKDSFFEKRIIRRIDEHLEVVDFHCTPIYSIAIIPKNSALDSLDSRQILYLYNIQESISRLASVIELLNNADHDDHDLICEKANTARRILELTLKIECCYREINVKCDYSKILLGSLLNCVRDHKEEDFKIILGRMAELLNEFSHDSGRKIDIVKAKSACLLVMLYLRLFQSEVNQPFL